MAQELNASSYSLDPPPSYAEAMECVHLSPRQLTQVMKNQQYNMIQNSNASPNNDQEKTFAKYQWMKKNFKIRRWIIQLVVWIFLIFVIILISCF